MLWTNVHVSTDISVNRWMILAAIVPSESNRTPWRLWYSDPLSFCFHIIRVLWWFSILCEMCHTGSKNYLKGTARPNRCRFESTKQSISIITNAAEDINQCTSGSAQKRRSNCWKKWCAAFVCCRCTQKAFLKISLWFFICEVNFLIIEVQ